MNIFTTKPQATPKTGICCCCNQGHQIKKTNLGLVVMGEHFFKGTVIPCEGKGTIPQIVIDTEGKAIKEPVFIE